MSQSIPGKPVFPELPWLSSRGSTHTTVARGTALWESLVGKPRGKASRESHRSLDPREWKRDTNATAREARARACPHSRRGLTPLGRLQKYPKIHVSTGEESSGSRTDPHKVLGPGIEGRGIPRGHRATRMGTGLSCGHQSASLRSPSEVESTCRNSRKSRRFSPPGEMRRISAEASRG